MTIKETGLVALLITERDPSCWTVGKNPTDEPEGEMGYRQQSPVKHPAVVAPCVICCGPGLQS